MVYLQVGLDGAYCGSPSGWAFLCGLVRFGRSCFWGVGRVVLLAAFRLQRARLLHGFLAGCELLLGLLALFLGFLRLLQRAFFLLPRARLGHAGVSTTSCSLQASV